MMLLIITVASCCSCPAPIPALPTMTHTFIGFYGYSWFCLSKWGWHDISKPASIFSLPPAKPCRVHSPFHLSWFGALQLFLSYLPPLIMSLLAWWPPWLSREIPVGKLIGGVKKGSNWFETLHILLDTLHDTSFCLLVVMVTTDCAKSLGQKRFLFTTNANSKPLNANLTRQPDRFQIWILSWKPFIRIVFTQSGDKNRKWLQACKCECRSFIITGRPSLMENRATNSTKRLSLLPVDFGTSLVKHGGSHAHQVLPLCTERRLYAFTKWLHWGWKSQSIFD